MAIFKDKGKGKLYGVMNRKAGIWGKAAMNFLGILLDVARACCSIEQDSGSKENTRQTCFMYFRASDPVRN